MKSGGLPRNCIIQCRRLFDALFLYCTAAFSVILLTWPWVMNFRGRFLNHWDPPFHAWKLGYMAGRILGGDPFFVSPDTNLLYPHSSALYFEALHWPASLLFALIRVLTDWPDEFIYHVVLIAFWALSAPCFGLLLIRLGSGRAAAAVGGIIYCILPYRMSYANEFQMQLAFMIPVFYFVLLRFLNRRRICDGIALALTWWLFAVTELYQAVFVLFTLPFIAVARFAYEPVILKDGKFWKSAAAGIVTGAASVFILLFPYIVCKNGGDVDRPVNEIIRHSIQPLSYFKPFGRYHFWDVNSKVEEFIAYPTVAVALLSFLAMIIWWKKCKSAHCEKKMMLTSAPLALILLLFTGIAFYLHSQIPSGEAPRILLSFWKLLSVLSLPAAVLFCFSPGLSKNERFMAGLFSAAVFCFFLSFGPTLDVGERVTFRATNKLYMFFLRHTPLLSGFRAACRFGVFTHFFMVCAASAALGVVFKRISRMRCRKTLAYSLCTLVGAAVVFLTALESRPPEKLLSFRNIDKTNKQPVVQRLTACPEKFVLAVVPMGSRSYDGMMMFSLLQDRFLSLYAWCGFIPPFADEVKTALQIGDIKKTCYMMSELWPECLILIDTWQKTRARPSYSAAHPGHIIHSETGGVYVDYVRAFSPFAAKIDADDRFALMKLQPSLPAKSFKKRFRTDYARKFPCAEIAVSGRSGAIVHARFNGHQTGFCRIGADGTARASFPFDAKTAVRTGHNELTLTSDEVFALNEFELVNIFRKQEKHEVR